jgi:hypothetical protein
MAQIRIVDDWRRSPAAGPSHYRSVMVIAEKWAEQRVLMRAYAESRDRLRPTIMLHGTELAIGPAGLDLHGPWGIHVGNGPDSLAQDIRQQLESSARRVAGSKGNPPRLADEPAGFGPASPGDWGSAAPRAVPRRHDPVPPPPPPIERAALAGAARLAWGSAEETQAPAPEFHPPPRTRGRTTRQPPVGAARTVLGYTSGAGAQSALVRLGLTPEASAQLGWLADRVVPGEFHLEVHDRQVLNALGQGELTAPAIAQMLGLADPVGFMAALRHKLESYDLPLIELGARHAGEPTYRLRR